MKFNLIIIISVFITVIITVFDMADIKTLEHTQYVIGVEILDLIFFTCEMMFYLMLRFSDSGYRRH